MEIEVTDVRQPMGYHDYTNKSLQNVLFVNKCYNKTLKFHLRTEGKIQDLPVVSKLGIYMLRGFIN